jgi:hypothetical protein
MKYEYNDPYSDFYSNGPIYELYDDDEDAYEM